MTKSVSIIGCGWVGQALAQQLKNNDYHVLASYRSQTTQAKLVALDINSKPLTLPLDEVSFRACCENEPHSSQALFQVDAMVIAIPPQLKKGQTDYAKKVNQLVALAEKGRVKSIIFLNSTAIYNGLHGEVDELSQLDLEAAKVAPLYEAEQAVKQFSGQSYILRLAGLVGPKRHPGRFLQLKREFANASSQVNLVHQSDVVNIIELLSKQQPVMNNSVIYDVVSQTHANRKEYYQSAAKALNLPQPCFNDDNEAEIGKKVRGLALRTDLAYDYVFDDLLVWLSDAQV